MYMYIHVRYTKYSSTVIHTPISESEIGFAATVRVLII